MVPEIGLLNTWFRVLRLWVATWHQVPGASAV